MTGGDEVIAMTIPGACGSLSKHHFYTFFLCGGLIVEKGENCHIH